MSSITVVWVNSIINLFMLSIRVPRKKLFCALSYYCPELYCISSRRYRCWELRESPRTSSAFIKQEGFIQVCGSSELREMLIITDQISAFKLYKLRCNCQYCISYSHESLVKDQVTAEPFMNAINIVFNTLARFNYSIQSSTTIQNQDGSSTSTWTWVRKPWWDKGIV